MQMLRRSAAFVASAAVTYVLAAVFYTQQILAKRAAIGLEFSPEQKLENYLQNLSGLAIGTMPSYGMMLTLALFIGFIVAAVVKQFLKPLSPIAYPTAGAAAVFTAVWAIETFVAKGAGALEGASGVEGVLLQCLAGLAGGVVFAVARGGAR